jgi:hypothetical protein
VVSCLCVNNKRMGYRETKRVEKTPATIDSHVKRSERRMEAVINIRTATSVELSVGMEWFVRVKRDVRTRVIGIVGVRERV